MILTRAGATAAKLTKTFNEVRGSKARHQRRIRGQRISTRQVLGRP